MIRKFYIRKDLGRNGWCIYKKKTDLNSLFIKGAFKNKESAESYCFMLNENMENIEALKLKIKEFEKDKKRINWLADKDNKIGNVQLPTECVNNNLSSLRDAIDDAMLL